MNIRKILNIPNKQHQQLIVDGIKELYNKVNVDYHKENDRERDFEKRSNGVCPRCRNSVIVNKIQNTTGSGYVSGESSFGFGYVNGSTKIITESVNHCNTCGNQWEKYKTRHIYRPDIIASWLNYISNDTDSLTKKIILEDLSNIPAESIWKVFKEVKSSCYYSTQINLTLSKIREHFKSIYDVTI